MEQKKARRILYTICFVCLAFIDWIRGSQDGVYWHTAINLTGFFVSFIMMSHYKWKKEPKKIYFGWMVIWLLGSVAGFGIWHRYPGEIFRSQYWAAAISVCAVGVAAIRIFRELKQTEGKPLGNHLLLICWVVMSVLMSCSRLGELWPVWYLVIFLLFYMVPFSQEERNDLWDGLADGLIISFFLLQIWAYGFRPYDEVRYKGAFSNCNMNALFYMVTYIALLYRSHSLRWQERQEDLVLTWKRKITKLVLWILTAGIWGFVFLTMTRTALLAVMAITAIYGVIEFRVICGEKFGKIIARGIGLLVSVVVLFPAVYLTVRYLPTVMHHPIWFSGEYNTDKVHSYDGADSEKYVSFDELFGGLGERFENTKETEEPIAKKETNVTKVSKVSTEDKGATEQRKTEKKKNAEQVKTVSVSVKAEPREELLTGDAANSSMRIRLEIYKKYLKNLTLTGHELEEGYYQITKNFHAWHAQNLFIQILFYYGIVAGILCMVLMAGLGIQTFRLAIRKCRCEDLLPLLVWLLFVGYGMLECVWYPGQIILLLIYLIPKIIIDRSE